MYILKLRKDKDTEWETLDVIVGPAGKDGYTPIKDIDYFDGKDGYTPVKGVDYFDGKDGVDYVLTDTDKAEIAQLVLNEFPVAEEVAF